MLHASKDITLTWFTQNFLRSGPHWTPLRATFKLRGHCITPEWQDIKRSGHPIGGCNIRPCWFLSGGYYAGWREWHRCWSHVSTQYPKDWTALYREGLFLNSEPLKWDQFSFCALPWVGCNHPRLIMMAGIIILLIVLRINALVLCIE